MVENEFVYLCKPVTKLQIKFSQTNLVYANAFDRKFEIQIGSAKWVTFSEFHTLIKANYILVSSWLSKLISI